jgi:glycosyltransferase involved in cell wall biosynthesis
MAPRTLIVIPAFNEEEALPGVLTELHSVLPEIDVLVVDDGSADRTADVAREHGAQVARLPFNLGVGGALRTGFRYAVRHDYDRVVQLDGDGQHDPGDVPALLAALDHGADMVVGSRFTSTEHAYQVSRIRSGGMRLLRLLLRLLSGQEFTDTSSGFRGFSRSTLEFFAYNYPVEYLGDTVEALLLACYAGFCVVETPVSMRVRGGGTPSARNVWLVFHYLRLLIALGTSASPRARVRTATR